MPSVPNSGPAAPPPPPVWNPQPAAGQPTGYGGFWIRVVAVLIDSFVLGAAGSVIGTVIGIFIGLSRGSEDVAGFIGSAVGFFLTWLYFALMESSERGATVGKMAMGLRVVTLDGQRLSFGQATGRYFAKILSFLTLYIGYLMVAFTDRKRGLHDIIAGTLVVKIR